MVKYDIYTAAYYGDVDRLKALLIVPDPPPIDAADSSADSAEAAVAIKEREAVILANAKALEDKLRSVGVITVQSKGRLPVRFGLGYRLRVLDPETSTVDLTYKLSKKEPLIPASPLHWAVLGRDAATICLLIDLGATTTEPTCGILSCSPEQICVANGMKNVLSLIATAQEELVIRKERAEQERLEALEKKRLADEEKQRMIQSTKENPGDTTGMAQDVNPEGYEEVDLEANVDGGDDL